MCVSPRTILAGSLLGLSAFLAVSAQAAVRREVNMGYIESLAERMSRTPCNPNADKVPDFLTQLDYDVYRDIRFNPLKALWSDENLPFRVDFFHPGHIFNMGVHVNEFTQTHEQEIPFNSGFFDYGRNKTLAEKIPTSLGYAGLRVRYQLNRVGVWDEVAVFLGASYFRAVGRGQVYGLSARALAIDTGLGSPEEFPRFREFWLGKPLPGATSLTIYGLLDSVSVTGAYKFVITPGECTRMDVDATLYFRSAVQRLGLTPFSSMFAWGENSMQKPVDYRPEVHDSDGLFLHKSNDELVWNPLLNPSTTRLCAYPADLPKGYGLMQRDRDFEHYQDMEAAYNLRPSVWVKPISMPRGKVTLFEFHTKDETNDNVVLFYEPETAPELRVPYRYSYSLFFCGQKPPSDTGTVVATRIGTQFYNPGVYEVIVDFGGKTLEDLPEVQPLKADVTVTGDGMLENTTLVKIRFNNTWRLVLYIRPTGPAPIDMSARLVDNGRTVTETWSYQWVR